ncbi:MAG: methyltransferase [Clostridia bacterium]|nr:methyltransferase [Clostridia bacterium]
MERIDDLQFRGLKILQDDGETRFSEDAVLLANFLRLRPEDRVIDLGSGGGILCILGEGKTGARFTGVERQARLVSLARRSAAMNGQAIEFLEMDLREAPGRLGHGAFTAAVMNPPYFQTGERSRNPGRAEARHGGAETLGEFLRAAFLLLKNGGRLFLCWPAAGLTDVLSALRAERLEPKRMAFVMQADLPRLALIEAKKLAGPGLLFTPPPQ